MSLVKERVETKPEIKIAPSTYSTNGSGPLPESAPYVDPYPYGWRYVQQINENADTEWIRVPLTLEDNLHPEEEDRREMNSDHALISSYIVDVFRKQISGIPKAFVFDDLRTDLNIPGVKPGRPDIAVTFNVQKAQTKWGTFYTDKEGTSPSFIIEITSPGTRHQDFGEKKDEYELAEVPYYLIIDNTYHEDQFGNTSVERQLFGYELNVRKKYVRMTPNPNGRLWFPTVELWVGLDSDDICFYNAKGELMKDYLELDEAYVESRTHFAEEKKARIKAEEKAQASEEKAQAAEEKAQAEADTRRAAEEELNRLRAIIAQQNL